jgi:ureidoglycolate hydrolase
MPATTLPLPADPLTAAAFAPFGWLPVADTDPADGAHTLHFEWADPHLNVIGHSGAEIDHAVSGAPVCAEMFRHRTHTQALMTLNVESVVAVAAPDTEFSSGADLESVRAFRLRPLDRFVLFPGTWHWGPFPLGSEPVQLLNVQGLRYADDNERVDLLERTASALEVVV